jgi:hypothetical protein
MAKVYTPQWSKNFIEGKMEKCKRRSYTTLFMHKDGGIFVKTRSEKCIEKLLKLGFVEIMTVHGWLHSTYFPEKSGAVWCGTAQQLFGKKSVGINKIIMAYCKVANE